MMSKILQRIFPEGLYSAYDIITQGDTRFDISSVESLERDDTCLRVNLVLRSKSCEDTLYDPETTVQQLNRNLYPGKISSNSFFGYTRSLKLSNGGSIGFKLKIIPTTHKPCSSVRTVVGGMYGLMYSPQNKDKSTNYFNTQISDIVFQTDGNSSPIQVKALILNVGNIITVILREGHQLEYSDILH